MDSSFFPLNIYLISIPKCIRSYGYTHKTAPPPKRAMADNKGIIVSF